MIFNPKEQYQRFRENDLEEFRKVIPQPWMVNSINYALAEFAIDGATQEELAGVRRFIHILTNLHEKPDVTPRLPVKTLSSYESPLLPKTEAEIKDDKKGKGKK